MRAPLVQWTPKMSVGVEMLDDEHQQLFALLNQLHEHIEAGQGTEWLGRTFEGLAEYTHTHFAHEEELFEQHGYPEAEGHIRQHRDFIRQIEEMQVHYNKGHFDTLSEGMVAMLRDWLTLHIQKSDQRYHEFFAGHGVR